MVILVRTDIHMCENEGKALRSFALEIAGKVGSNVGVDFITSAGDRNLTIEYGFFSIIGSDAMIDPGKARIASILGLLIHPTDHLWSF